jgi:hypothetical protein
MTLTDNDLYLKQFLKNPTLNHHFNDRLLISALTDKEKPSCWPQPSCNNFVQEQQVISTQFFTSPAFMG